jgi:hypothetical protein
LNREIFPGGIYPLQGDVTSRAGSQNVTVTGLQGIPVAAGIPTSTALLTYDVNNHQWTAGSPGNSSIQVNGVSVSDDYIVSVNTPKQILVNGA